MRCVTYEEMVYFLDLTKLPFDLVSDTTLVVYAEKAAVVWNLFQGVWCVVQ